MNWVNKIDAIYCINLAKREDRLLEFTGMMEEYEIPFKRVEAVEKSNGAEGLRDTMVNIFTEALEKGHKQILVFEDDCIFVEGKEYFHQIMNSVIDNLPELWIMCFLGNQVTGKFIHRHHPNILSATKMFSTHAVLYSERGMKECLSQGFDYPIDNYYVEKIEPLRASYTIYPMLATQREGFSDIYKNKINWQPFINGSYNQKYSEFGG
jgi:GR25 family glycosyltransferase involved in LPS biosynthesis